MTDNSFQVLFNDKTKINRISVFGERSSGTNYCSFLIGKNLDVELSDDLGWKHGFLGATAVRADQLSVICTRNIFDWVRSMYVKPWHCPKSMYENGFSHYLKTPWTTICDRPRGCFKLPTPDSYRGRPLLLDRNPFTGAAFENIVQMRSAKYRAFLGFEHRQINTVVVQLEYFQSKPVEFLEKLAESFQLSMLGPFKNSQRKFGEGRGFVGKDERRDEVKTISDDDRNFIMKELDPFLEARMGYHY